METYRMSSKINQDNREYQIQTINDSMQNMVMTTVHVDGRSAETTACPHPSNINGEELLSLVKLTHGEKKKEVELMLSGFRTALQTGDAAMMYHLGTAFYYKGLYDEAETMFTHVVNQNPGHHQAYNYLGMTLLALGKIDSAVQAASRAVEQRPSFADYRNNLGEAYIAGNACERAIAELEQAIAINLYYGDAYFNLGLAHLQRILHGLSASVVSEAKIKVIDYLTKASVISTQFKTTGLSEGMQLLERGDMSAALIRFKDVQLARKDSHRAEFAAFYMKFVLHPDLVSEKVVADRIEFLKNELRKNPHYIDLMSELAQCYFEQAKLSWQNGIDQYRKCLQMQPGNQQVRHSVDKAEKIYGSMVSDLEQGRARESF